MTDNNLLMQFQADLLGVDVVRPVIAETTALGAAYAAGLAVEFWSDLDELRSRWSEGKRWIPQMSSEMSGRLHERWKHALPRSFDWV